MSSVGTYLRELRQRRGVSLEEIARSTRVAPRYLEALEADAFDALPSPVFTRGFIRAYCQTLQESPDEALATYDRREGRTPAPARAAPPTRAADRDPRGRGAVLVSFVLLVVLGAALFAVALVIHPRGERSADVRPGPPAESQPVPTPGEAAPRPADPSAQAPTSTSSAPAPPAVTTVAPPTAVPASPPVASPPSPPAVAPSAPPVGGPPAAAAPRPAAAAPPAAPALDVVTDSVTSPYRLVARTSEATWIRVRTEDGRTSEENVPAGEVREWVSNRPFVLTIGNAGGVSFELNGRALPTLGPKGVVIPRIVLPPDAR
jgi:cytoskeleton protein RodZ